MNSKRLWATTATTFLALSAVGPRVWAQSSDMAACPAGWEWNENSRKQDPCAISSILDAACRGEGSYTIPPLNSTQNYVPPQRDSTSDLKCDCDTVMYSLYMACSTCQGGLIYSWTKWIAQCDTVYVTQYPHDVPYGTSIPHWAFYDITTLPDQTYSDTVATSVGRDPEATPKAVSTATLGHSSTSRTLSSPSSSASSSSASGPDPTQTSGGSGTKSNLAVIVGGAVGGVVLVGVVVVTVILLTRRKRGGGNNPPPQPLPPQETLEYQKVQPVSPMLSPASPTMPIPYNTYYNPEDPTTFPPPMGDGQSSLTYTNTLSPHGPHGQGQYGGMPEL